MSKPKRRDNKKIKVHDAANLVQVLDRALSLQHRPRSADEFAQMITRGVATAWAHDKVMLRLDPTFVEALLDTDGQTELGPSWLSHSAFGTFAVSLVEPIEIHDGNETLRYLGFIAVGAQTRPMPGGQKPPIDVGPVASVAPAWTTYHDLHDVHAEGVKIVWLFERADRWPGAQTISAAFSGDNVNASLNTIDALIEKVSNNYSRIEGDGSEANQLVTISLTVLLYLASQEPDLEYLPEQQVRRPHQLRDVAVANLGWRVGADLKLALKQRPIKGDDESSTGLQPGRRLPGHIRRAHWHRVRIATRNAQGEIVGDRTGEIGIDWDYQLRWYPPTPVNAKDGIQPTIRDAAQ